MEQQDFIKSLPTATVNGKARAAAYEVQDQVTHRSITSVVSYRSGGQVLIVGDGDAAIRLAQHLSPTLHCTVLDTTSYTDVAIASQDRNRELDNVPADARTPTAKNSDADFNGAVLQGRVEEISGYLGHFDVLVGADDTTISLADVVFNGQGRFDLVLDLTSPPHLKRDILPPGYFAPGDDSTALQGVLDEMPELVGEFEKPKYFDYDPDICAHGRSGIHGCTRCLEACPTLAITSKGDKVEVDPHLCQGGGSCASACPTGAIKYAYPKMSYLLDVLRKTLNEYRHAGGVHACLLFYAAADANALTRRVAQLPEYVLPMEIDEIGAVGMEAWFAALAYGASHVVLWSESQVAPSVLRESQTQLAYAGAMLEGMGYSSDRLQLMVDESADKLIAKLNDPREQSDVFPATFAVFDEKQTNLRLALDHLYAQAPTPRPFVSLPTGAPFGEVWVSQERCTLCMACASQCPTSALLAGDDVPQLKFIEGNCIQCGLCARSCPENAIGPSPRYLYDSSQRRVARVMYEEQPFNCVACGKPFATRKMIDKMTQKLTQHWMFQSKDAMRRVQMCDDCRVKDMYRKEAGMDVHAKIE